MPDGDKVIERIVDRTKAAAEQAIENTAESHKRQLSKELEAIKEATRAILPVNILEILSKGGFVGSKEINLKKIGWSHVQSEMDVAATFYGRSDWTVNGKVQGGGFRYRLTVIVERLPDEEASDGQ